MNPTGTHELATDAALALATKYLDPPVRLSDVRLFTSGHLHLWTRWPTLHPLERRQIARYIKLRPDSLAEDHVFKQKAQGSLNKAHRFRWHTRDEHHVLESTFELAPGKPIGQLLEELLSKLEKRRTPQIPGDVDEGQETIELGDHDRRHFAIPRAHLPTDRTSWLKLKTTEACSSFSLDKDRLVAIAKRLDQCGLPMTHHAAVVHSFFEQTVVHGTSEPFGRRVSLDPGKTQLIIAPTGSGKSVALKVVALEAAERHTNVAIVVPDIKEVLRQTHELQEASLALGLNIRVTPVNSPRKLLEKAGEALRHPPAHDPTGMWTVDRLAYACQLSAYADGPLEAGREPCFGLRQRRSKGDLHVICPFALTCGKFEVFREATTATILVVNHHAFLSGQVRTPMFVEEERAVLPTIMELVMARCALVLIDEVDHFQKTAIQKSIDDLQMSARGRLSPLQRLLISFESKCAADEIPPEVPVESVRRPIHLLVWLAELFAALVNADSISWPRYEMMRWSGSDDTWLASHLFGDSPDAMDRLEALFTTEPIASDATAERLRAAVHLWLTYDVEEERDTGDLRADLMRVLGDWPRSFDGPTSRVSKLRARLADSLILRALLSRLEQGLNRLRPQLATLEDSLPDAADVRSRLQGYVPWRPSPTGAIGRRVIGFSFKRDDEGKGTLHAQALTGDPHGVRGGTR